MTKLNSGKALAARADELATAVLAGRCDPAICVREISAINVALEYPRALRRWTFLEEMLADLEQGRNSYFEPNLTPERFAEHVREAAGKLLRRDFHDERIFGT